MFHLFPTMYSYFQIERIIGQSHEQDHFKDYQQTHWTALDYVTYR